MEAFCGDGTGRVHTTRLCNHDEQQDTHQPHNSIEPYHEHAIPCDACASHDPAMQFLPSEVAASRGAMRSDQASGAAEDTVLVEANRRIAV